MLFHTYFLFCSVINVHFPTHDTEPTTKKYARESSITFACSRVIHETSTRETMSIFTRYSPGLKLKRNPNKKLQYNFDAIIIKTSSKLRSGTRLNFIITRKIIFKRARKIRAMFIFV